MISAYMNIKRKKFSVRYKRWHAHDLTSDQVHRKLRIRKESQILFHFQLFRRLVGVSVPRQLLFAKGLSGFVLNFF